MRPAFAFLAGAVLATFAPLAGAVVAVVLHERNLRRSW